MKILFKRSFFLLFFTLVLFTRCRCPKDSVQSTSLKPKKQGGMSVGGGKHNQKVDPVTESTVDNDQHELNEKLRQMYERVKRGVESRLHEICECKKELMRNVWREPYEGLKKRRDEFMNQKYGAGKDKLLNEAYIKDKRVWDDHLQFQKQIYKNEEERLNQRYQRMKEAIDEHNKELVEKLKKKLNQMDDKEDKELNEKLDQWLWEELVRIAFSINA